MADFGRDFWIRETGKGQQVVQLHDIDDDDGKRLFGISNIKSSSRKHVTSVATRS